MAVRQARRRVADPRCGVALQLHYAVLQSLALDKKEDVEGVPDETMPKPAAMNKVKKCVLVGKQRAETQGCSVSKTASLSWRLFYPRTWTRRKSAAAARKGR